MLPLLTDKLKPLSDYVIVDIPDSIIGNIDKRVEALGVEEAFNEELVYLDCTRYDKEGKFRLMQTVGVPYSIELGKAIYIMNAYQYDGANKLLERHQMNLEYEKEHPPVTYKNKNTSYECQCQNLWFYEPNNLIQCIEPNVTECVVYNYEDKFFDKKYFDKKYLVNDTNECVNKCPTGSYSFNYVCYDKCPTYTKDNQTNHICRCNKYAGYWYEYERYNLTYLQCAVDKCPANNNESAYIRENLLETESKCLITCRENEEFPFSLRKVCVKECPYFTHTNKKYGQLFNSSLIIALFLTFLAFWAKFKVLIVSSKFSSHGDN